MDVEYSEFDPDVMSSLLRLSENEKKERFLLDYLGSVETSLYKGNIVLCQAVKKIYSKEEDMCQLPTVLQITEKGIKMQSKVSNHQVKWKASSYLRPASLQKVQFFKSFFVATKNPLEANRKCIVQITYQVKRGTYYTFQTFSDGILTGIFGLIAGSRVLF